LSTTNTTKPDPRSKPGRRGGKPATNRLSYGAAYSCMLSAFNACRFSDANTCHLYDLQSTHRTWGAAQKSSLECPTRKSVA
jgi:hypothetical protein